MPKIFKQDSLEYKEDSKTIDKFKLQTVIPRLSAIAESKHLVFDLRLLNSGQYSFPYHFHRNAEELIMVLTGTMTLRTPKGLEIVTKGDIIFFEMSDSGAHQFYNHDSNPCTYLDIRTTVGLDVCEYPDSGKINITPFIEIFDKNSKVDYFKGEENVDKVWEEIKKK